MDYSLEGSTFEKAIYFEDKVLCGNKNKSADGKWPSVSTSYITDLTMHNFEDRNVGQQNR